MFQSRAERALCSRRRCGRGEARMAIAGEEEIGFAGATGRLRGRVHNVSGPAWGALVLCHGRHEDMEGRLLVGLAGLASDLGLWTFRFNFAFHEAGTEPSAGHADEIADLHAAIRYARRTAKTNRIYVAGRGLGAWATVAAATDEFAAGAILLGLSYQTQPERRMALERLAEFEVPTLAVVGFESDRLDLPDLQKLVALMPSVNLAVIGRADHRLEDAKGRPMTEAVLAPCETWLRQQKEKAPRESDTLL